MSHEIYQQFVHKIENRFPKAYEQIVREKVAIKNELISPFHLKLPITVFENANQFVKEIYELYEHSKFSEHANTKNPEFPAHNLSLLTCFDFHFSNETDLKLIEINTNASLCLPYLILREIHGLPFFLNQPDKFTLKSAFDELHREFMKAYSDIFSNTPLRFIDIVDTSPSTQGLYFEFLLYKNWLEDHGYNVKIMNTMDWSPSTERPAPLVYNRNTDFFLKEQNTQKLRQSYFNKSIALSPNPAAYSFFADKNQLSYFRNKLSSSNSSVAQIIPESRLFKDFESKDKLWAQRKKYFLKPSQSYGSKSAFSGKSISKKMFESIYQDDFLAQERIPAGKVAFPWKSSTIEHKFDLRIYANSNGIFEVGARLYQGQTTNMKTPFGGIAPVSFE